MKYALLRTLPGRAIVIGTAIKIAVFALGLVARVPAFVRVVDTVASVAVVAGAAYFLWRGLAFAQRRLLWRVRLKLIISYIFIGFIPAILIVAFFLLGGLLLFSNFSSYLLQTRLHTLTDRAAAVAATTAIEIQRAGGRDAGAILARREAAIATEFPGASLALVPMDRGCGETRDGRPAPRTAPQGVAAVETAGPWDHVDPPTRMPEWLGCAGFSGLLAYGDGTAQQLAGGQPAILPGEEGANRRVQLLARAVAVPDSLNARGAVVVDLLVNGAVKQQLRRETGVELTSVRTVVGDVPLLPGRAGGAPEPTEAAASTLPVSSVSFPEVVDWTTGQPRSGAVMAAMQLSIGEIYDRISAAQGSIANRSFGQGLLLVLIVIGVLFLIIEAIALVAGLALARSITGSIHG